MEVESVPDPPVASRPGQLAVRRWPLGVLAFGGLLLGGAFMYMVPQEMSSIYAEFGLDEQSFGILAAGIAFASSVLGISAAWLVPRLGLAGVCLLGTGVFSCGLIGCVAAPGHLLPLFFGLLIAVGMAYLHMANGLVVQLAPDHTAMATNLLHGCNALGKALGPALALIGTTWREPFLTVAGLMLLVGAAGYLGRRGWAVRGGEAHDAGEAPARQALRQPLFWLCAALFLPIVGMEQVVNFWLPHYLQADPHLDRAAAELLAVTAASTILWTQCAGRFLAPLALLRVPPFVLLAVCIWGCFGILVGTQLGYWTGWTGTTGLVLCGIGFAIPYPTFFALACRYFPEHRGLVSVVSGAATSLGFIAFSAVGGILGKVCGLAWTLRLSPLLGVVALLGVSVVYVAGERRLARAGAARR